jgi:lipid-A-disaccharide synthase
VSDINKKNILIIAGEASGDLHGAALVREIRKLDPELIIRGIGGKKMEEAGVDIIIPSSDLAVVGLTEVFSKIQRILKAHSKMRSLLKNSHPDLLILIDFPDFNISLAGTAKRCNVPVLYYISPQLWAWRKGRVKKITRRVDKMAVILPFEKEFYLNTGMGIDVEYVGHPLMDQIPDVIDKDAFKKELGSGIGTPAVGLLPGSRTEEIKTLLPAMIGAAEILSLRYPDLQCLLPIASTISREFICSFLSGKKLNIHITENSIYNVLGTCDAVMVASGTATLETALMGVPMVIAYRVSPLSYRIGKMIIDVPFISLVNLIAGEEVVPEVLQDDVTPGALADRVLMILENQTVRKDMIQKLFMVRQKIGAKGASARTAGIAMSMMTKHSCRKN